MKKLGIFETLLTIIILTGITTALYLYTSGYRLNRDKDDNTIDVSKTGMISAKSIPDSANVYLDGKLVSATDDTIPGIAPGIHTLKIVKKGFVDWTKEIEVFDELVTDITAVLISQSPRLEPLTNTGATHPAVSPSLSKLAYFSNDLEQPGIWVTPLSGGGISLFKTNPTLAIQDTRFTKYSQGEIIEWSPDEKNLLVTGQNNIFYLVDLETNTAQSTSSPEKVREEWVQEDLKKKLDFVEKLDIPENIKQLAVSPKAVWAPDDKKFLYTNQSGDTLEYKVYNLENPIPVGEKVENTAFVTKVSDTQPNLSWYADSFHLILVEGNVQNDKRGTISLIRIDGSNKIEIYNNTLYDQDVFSTPIGDKLIVLTSFKSGDKTDLYTIGIR